MKSTITILLSLLLSAPAQAGAETGELSAFHYIASGKHYFEVANGLPGSTVEFYSERHGGKLLKQLLLGEAGSLQFSEQETFAPAFVLNPRHAHEQGLPGSGKIFFLEPAEFSIRELSLSNSEELATLSFTASADENKEILFRVMKSYDGQEYVQMQEIKAFKGAAAQRYYFSETEPAPGVQYRIDVYNMAAGLRYSSDPLSVSRADAFSIYPSLASSQLNVLLPSAGSYSICNAAGQVVRQGNISGGKTAVSVSDLPSGVYLFSAACDKERYSSKFVRE